MTKSSRCELYVIGSGTGLPYIKRTPPGVLLRTEDRNILLDCGAGTFQRLIKIGLSYQDIDYILFSHLHPDHTLDLVSFLFAARNSRDPRKKDIEIIGPEGFRDFYSKLLEVHGSAIVPESYSVVIKEIREGGFDFGNWQLLAKPLTHTDEAVGFRIQTKSGKLICYSGDTDYCENIIELARNSDLLVLECSHPDGFKVDGHLTPSLAGKIAAQAGSKKLVLTHLYPVCDEYPVVRQCRSVFKGEIILSSDLLKIMI